MSCTVTNPVPFNAMVEFVYVPFTDNRSIFSEEILGMIIEPLSTVSGNEILSLMFTAPFP